jgi:hypothetical protein
MPFTAYLSYIGLMEKPRRVVKTIRMDEDVYHRARVAAVVSRKSLGRWVEEAVLEKLKREGALYPLRTKEDGARG